MGGVWQRGKDHLSASAIAAPRRIESNAPGADGIQRDRKAEGRQQLEAGGDGAVGVHHQAVGIGAAGQVAAPAGENIAGIRHGGQHHDAGAVKG